MVTWIPLENKAYEISLSSKQEEFPYYFDIAQKLINSFEFINRSETISNVLLEDTEAKEDPLLVLKLRFAKGEINCLNTLRIYSILKRDS